MEQESKSGKRLHNLVERLGSIGGEIMTAVDEGAIEEIVILWEDYQTAEREWKTYLQKDMAGYTEMTNILQEEVLVYMRDHGMNPEQLCQN